MAEPSTSRRAWARTYGVVLSASCVNSTNQGETWRVEAKGQYGELAIDVETDGSYTPDPFDCLFGTWEWEEPTPAELATVTAVLGAKAVADLALLVDW